MASFMEELEHLEIEMEEIKLATGNFDDSKFIGIGGFGKVYGGKLSRFNERNMVAFTLFEYLTAKIQHNFKLNCLNKIVGFCTK
ncbi:kinase-like domain, phloem protein 2-like protein [Tanacetum coccineum]|uniref:Kinase-like domain, phloem protein 2-like protein n=1 Tax=Tanacetum coccineum TaxID=301880 RepID=A0ABQ5HQ85_9ASTR